MATLPSAPSTPLTTSHTTTRMPQTPVSHSAIPDDMDASDAVLDISRHTPVAEDSIRYQHYAPDGDAKPTAMDDSAVLEGTTLAHDSVIATDEASPGADASAHPLRRGADPNANGRPSLGIDATSPAHSLPSPPLTRRTSNASHSSTRSRSPHTSIPIADDEEITFSTSNWRTRTGMAESPAEEDVAVFSLGEEEDESGDPGPSTSAKRREIVHPLQDLNASRPSPPPWEVIHPPPGNGDRLEVKAANVGTYSTHRTLGKTSGMGYDGLDDRASRRLIPKSSYYFGPPPAGSAYGSEPIGHIGVHYPREVVRIERDFSGGEVIQFASSYPLELEGRITPTQFLEAINAINELLISAHSLRWAFVDNALEFFSLQLSRLIVKTHYEREMVKLKRVVDDWNHAVFNPAGLNILWPRKVAFLFLEIEYY